MAKNLVYILSDIVCNLCARETILREFTQKKAPLPLIDSGVIAFLICYFASLETFTNSANAAGSFTAISASILRFTSTPALVKPAMKRE